MEKKQSKRIILLILKILLYTTLIISICYIFKWYIDGKQNKKIEEKVLDSIIIENNENIANAEYNIDFEKLKSMNNDVVAWLKVYGTQVEYPVVQTTDNSYYLNRNLDKKYNVSGWIFADYKNKLDGTDKNIVIYGHNMLDNAMFGSLENILSEEWYNNSKNYIIDFITPNEFQKYQVFSVYKIKNENYYIDTEFDENEFEDFVKTLKERSVKDFNIDVDNTDNILTISTCDKNNNYRIVLHAKKINN